VNIRKTCQLPAALLLFSLITFFTARDTPADASPFRNSAKIELEYAVPDTSSLIECCVIYNFTDSGADTSCNCNGAVCISAFDREKIKIIRSVPEKFKLVLKYSGRTIITPELKYNGMNTYHKLLIENGEAVDVTPVVKTKYSSYSIALLATLVIELIIAGIFFLYKKIPARYLFIVAVINLITHPLLWITAANITGFGTSLIWLEGIVTAAEGYAIFRFLNGRISLFSSFLLSIIMNVVSFFAGGFIYMLLY